MDFIKLIRAFLFRMDGRGRVNREDSNIAESELLQFVLQMMNVLRPRILYGGAMGCKIPCGKVLLAFKDFVCNALSRLQYVSLRKKSSISS